MDDPIVNYKTLLQGYRNLLSNYPDYEKADSAKNTIAVLEIDSARFAHQLAIQNCDTLIILEKIESWNNFVPSKVMEYDSAYASRMVKRLDSLTTNLAHINKPSKFVTCETVVNRQPKGIRDHFSTGPVWAWAQVHSPGRENVTFKWYTNGNQFDETTGQIGRSLKPGYRIFYWRSFGADKKGRNEVRLYNSQNILIGRKVFFVR